MMSNKKLGNDFEQEFCDILFENGFWVHNMAQNAAGQPADVIAVRNERAYLIDCKVCQNDEFPLSRIEPNQESAMTLWDSCGNNTGWFALKFSDGIYMIEANELFYFRERDIKKITQEDVKSWNLTIDRWVKNL